MEVTTKPNYAHVLKQINGAIRTLEMYPPGHPATLQATKKLFSALQEIFKETNHFTISQVEDRIVVNGKNIEGSDILKRLMEEFNNENISSLSLTKGLTKEELGKFLSFFVKPSNTDAPSKNLPEFLKRNQIQSIRVDQLRYELVTEDEVMVKAAVVEGADLKAQISKIMKDNPDLVRDIVLNKSGRQVSLGEEFGSEIDLKQLTDEIGKQIKSLSDDEVLSLLASSVEQSWKKLESKDSGSELNEVVDLVHKLLEDREKKKLLPQVKKMLSEHGIIEKKHLDFLFEEKWLKSQEVLDELIKMIEKPGTEEVDFERFMFLWQRVISSEDSQIKSNAMDKLLSRLDSEDTQTRSFAVSALERALSHFIQEKMEFEFSYIKDRLYEMVQDQLMPEGILKHSSHLLKIIFLEMIKRGELTEAHQILLEYNARLSPKVACPQEVKKIAQDFIGEVSNDATLAILISQMKEGAPCQDIKLTEEILESLDKDKVAERLTDVFTLDDRTARMSALRVLNRLGKSSVSALSALLSNPGIFIRKKETELLVDAQWYKVRNAIYVLGNIPDEESVQTLSKLGKDPDIRVRLEIVKALEKIGRPESVDVLLTLLNDREDEVRRSTIRCLSMLSDRRSLKSLIEHFRQNREDKIITLTAIGKIGGEESVNFLLNILWEKEKTIRYQASKQKDEIKIAVLSILGKIGSPELTSELEKFVKKKRKGLKGLKSLLVKDRVRESANRVLNIIESKNKDNHQATDRRMSIKSKIVS
ncbi:MAG: HEAT repeat domain-containing protein [candidate division Zixibacteria bacterium]|nr:HEAT repeat domain-containing protein [candidate division Zixibacteria bacterium]